MSEIDILKSVGCSSELIKHALAVSKNASIIAEKVKIKVNKDLVKRGGLFHDLGRCKTHKIDHAVVGSELARKLGLGEDIANIVERHIGAGISLEEAKRLGLPVKEYIPITPEEKIVAYADKLTEGTGMVSFEESLEHFKESLGEQHPSVARFIALHEEIQSWINK